MVWVHNVGLMAHVRNSQRRAEEWRAELPGLSILAAAILGKPVLGVWRSKMLLLVVLALRIIPPRKCSLPRQPLIA